MEAMRRPRPRGSRLACAALLATLGLWSSEARSQGSITLAIGDNTRVPVLPGGRISLPLIVLPSGGANISSLQGEVAWGPSRLTLDSVRTGAFGTLTVNDGNAVNGRITLSAFRASGQVGRDTVARMYFTASGSPNSTRVAFTPSAVGNVGGLSVLAISTVQNADVCIGSHGAWGDVNDDNSINIIDAQQLARFSVGLSVAAEGILTQRGDVTSDGAVNIIDAQQVARFTIALPAFPRIGLLISNAPSVATISGLSLVDITPDMPPNLPLNTGAAAVGKVARVLAEARDAGSADVTGCVNLAYSSTNPTVASISPSGVVSAKSPGTPTNGVAGGGASATVNVTVVPVTPATISIASITAVNAAGVNAPVNPAAVSGNINVALNIDPGTEFITKVVVSLGGVRADSQVFTPAQSAAMAAASSMPGAAAISQVLFSINTAAYNAVTGVPRWLNGPKTVTAELFVAGGAAGMNASQGSPITLANANGWISAVAVTGAAAEVNNALGYKYRKGNLFVSVTPLIYSPGISLAGGTVSFGGLPCDASGIGTRTMALTAPVSGSSAWTAVLTAPSVASAGNVTNYEFDAAACPGLNPNGEVPTATLVNSLGNAMLVGALAVNVAEVGGIRLDNRAPSAPILNYVRSTGRGPRGRSGHWMNHQVVLNGLATGIDSDGLICNIALGSPTVDNCPSNSASTDRGIGTITFTARVAVGTGAGSIATTSAAATQSSLSFLGNQLLQSVCVIGFASDALGNRSAANNTGLTATDCLTVSAATGGRNIAVIGIDVTAPTVAFHSAGFEPGQRVGTLTLGREFVAFAIEGASGTTAGIATVSSAPTSGPVLMNIQRRRADGILRFNGDGSLAGDGTSTIPVNTGLSLWGGLIGTWQTNIMPLSTSASTAAYWTATALAQDAAGNRSVPIVRVIVADATAATVSAPSRPATISGAFASSMTVSDNLDIRDASMGANYYCPNTGSPACLGSIFVFAAGTHVGINPFDATPLKNTNVVVNSAFNMPLVLQATSTSNVPLAYDATANNLQNVTALARDQTQGFFSGTGSAGFTLATPASGFTPFTNWQTTTSAPTLCAVFLFPNCSVSTATPATSTLTAVALGPTVAFANPFSRVDFYIGSAFTWYFVGSSTAPTTTDNGIIRQHYFQVTLSALSALDIMGFNSASTGHSFYVQAIGINAAGTVGLTTRSIIQTINY